MIRLLFSFLVVTLLAPDTRAAERYFPPGTLSSFEEQWYGKQLSALNERPLFSEDNKGDVLRFTWLRTFHHPWIVRLNIGEDGTGRLIAKYSSGAGGYEPGKLSGWKITRLPEPDARTVMEALKVVQFWQMLTESNIRGMDGAEWILEARVDGRYHVVVRWSPRDGGFRAWAITFMTLAGVNLDPLY